MSVTQEWFVDGRSGVRMPAGVLRFPVDRCVTPLWNVNVQSPATFKNLVDSIRTHGFMDIPQVAPLDTVELRAEYLDASHDAGEYWLVIGGAHRKDAAKMLDMEVWPAVLMEGWSGDMVKMANMRLNSLRGRPDAEKFRTLYEEMKSKGYGDDVLQVQMGLQKTAMKKLLKAAVKDLPPDVKRLVEESGKDIDTPDDLARVLKELFSKHGGTLPFSYLVFAFGGKTNLWVRMDRPVKDAMDGVTRACEDKQLDINRVIAELLSDAAAVQAATVAAVASAQSEDALFV